MNEIEHHVAIHFQNHQKKLNIFEDFRACVDENIERRSKKNLEKFLNFNVSLYIFLNKRNDTLKNFLSILEYSKL